MDSRKHTTKSSGRIYALDGLRGVSCVVVLLLHIGIMIQPFGPDAPYDLIPGTAAVMVFYVLSGIVLSLVPLKSLKPIDPHGASGNTPAKATAKSYDWFAYYPRRVVRLCVPLIIAILLGVIAGFIGQSMGSTSRSVIAVDYTGSLSDIAHDILMQFDILFNVSDDSFTLYGEPLVRVDSPVWSMSWELWFSLTLPLCIFFALIFKRDKGIVAVLILCILFAHFTNYFPLRFAIMFLLGVFIAKHHDTLAQKIIPKPIAPIAFLACLILIELPYLGDESNVFHVLALTVMNAACAGLVVLTLTDGLLRRILSTRLCQWLGKISYSMYLTHAIVIGSLGALLDVAGLAPCLQALIALVASFVIAWVFWYAVERPSIVWSHHIGKVAASAERPS